MFPEIPDTFPKYLITPPKYREKILNIPNILEMKPTTLLRLPGVLTPVFLFLDRSPGADSLCLS